MSEIDISHSPTAGHDSMAMPILHRRPALHADLPGAVACHDAFEPRHELSNALWPHTTWPHSEELSTMAQQDYWTDLGLSLTPPGNLMEDDPADADF